MGMPGRWRAGRLVAIAGCWALSAACLSALAVSADVARAAPQFYENSKLVGSTPVPTLAWGEVTFGSSVLGKVHCLAELEDRVWNADGRGEGEVGDFDTGWCEAPEEERALEFACDFNLPEPCPYPWSPAVTAEMPPEKRTRQGEVCIEKTKTLEQCSAKNAEGDYTERETKLLTSEFHRRAASLPWKLELVSGEREEEEGVLEKVGVHEYGESGTATAQSTSCYPTEGGEPASFKALPSGCIGIDIVLSQVPLEFVYYGTQEIFGLNGVRNGLTPSRLQFIDAGKLFSSEGLEGEGSVQGLVKLLGWAGQELVTAR